MNDGPLPVDPTPESLQKEVLKLRRRLGRLEAQLEDVEAVRDTNLRFLDRVSGELEAEKARSRALLLNVLPEAIVKRLDDGEQMIADRYDDVAVVFSDFVGFTEISARLELGELVSRSTRCSRHSTRPARSSAWRRSRRSATRTWRRPGCPEHGPITWRRRRNWRLRCAPQCATPGTRGRSGSACTAGRSSPV